MTLWIIVFVAMLVFEIITIGNLVTIWFAIGAIAALLTSALTANLVVQILIFIIVSIGSLILIRPVMTKTLQGQTVATNADAIIGRILVVKETITPDQWGSVMADGSRWTCVSVSNNTIPVGARVEVVAISGVKLVVKEIEGELS